MQPRTLAGHPLDPGHGHEHEHQQNNVAHGEVAEYVTVLWSLDTAALYWSQEIKKHFSIC